MAAYIEHTQGNKPSLPNYRPAWPESSAYGRVRWSMSIDADGYRTYTIVHRVYTDDPNDGPWVVANCPGLPRPHIDFWWFTDELTQTNEIDIDAICTSEASITAFAQQEGESVRYWNVEQKFSTKPINRCPDEDPLTAPPKISGSFTNVSKEATHDWQGNAILSSSFEPIHGPQVEFDETQPKVIIEVNMPVLNLVVLSSLVNTVNSDTMWNLGPRKIKLSQAPWSMKVDPSDHDCQQVYYTVTYEFDINYDGWDKFPIDEGTKIVSGKWEDCDGTPSYTATGDPDDPRQFIRAKDCHDEITNFLLKRGAPLPSGEAPYIVSPAVAKTDWNNEIANSEGVKRYRETDFIGYGFPADLPVYGSMPTAYYISLGG